MRLTILLTMLTPLAATADPPPVSVRVHPEEVEFLAAGKTVTRYRYAGEVEGEKPGTLKPLAKPYCYPLLTPAGVAVTRGWPVEQSTPGETTDHPHQRSLWFCHGDVIPEGVTWSPRSRDKHVAGVDFWTETPGSGRIVCDRVSSIPGSRSVAGVLTENRWLTPDGQAILKESRTIRLRTLEGVEGPVLEFEIALTAVVPVTFGDTKEGSFGLRVADAMALSRKDSAGVVTSSTGTAVKSPAKDALPVWGERAAWHDYTGDQGGVAIFDDSANPHPAAWHTRAYGLMAANPFARQRSGFPSLKSTDAPLVRLAAGETLRLKYAAYPHAPGADVGAAYAAWCR